MLAHRAENIEREKQREMGYHQFGSVGRINLPKSNEVSVGAVS